MTIILINSTVCSILSFPSSVFWTPASTPPNIEPSWPSFPQNLTHYLNELSTFKIYCFNDFCLLLKNNKTRLLCCTERQLGINQFNSFVSNVTLNIPQTPETPPRRVLLGKQAASVREKEIREAAFRPIITYFNVKISPEKQANESPMLPAPERKPQTGIMQWHIGEDSDLEVFWGPRIQLNLA